MSKICYRTKTFNRDHRAMIARADEILGEYQAQGLVLTLRQLYYQFVARDFIPNSVKSYKNLGGIIGDARIAGMLDWEAIEDRGRNLATLTHFDGAKDALTRLAGWYHVDMWEGQEYRPEVWIEKDALSGVVAGVCEENDVPYFACKGYTSLSEMWRASLRLRRWHSGGQRPWIIHFGDHDPSGIDMSRDITERLQHTFMANCHFVRAALNMDQIEEYSPPPNPAKVTDSRYKVYVKNYGDESWELDALDPPKFRRLIEDQLKVMRGDTLWNQKLKEKARVKETLTELAGDWEGLSSLKDDSARLQEFTMKLAGRIYACHEVLAHLAEKKTPLTKRRRNVKS